jgi:regulator of cell morphogenesis and NO signaling
VTLDANATLGEFAAHRPSSIPVFERLNLDYCCGGKRTLAEACRARALEPDRVLTAIADEERGAAQRPERSWDTASMTELADHIEATHHAFCRDALTRLRATLPRVVAAHGERHPELPLVEKIVSDFAEELYDHMVREERVVFPWLRRLERPSEIQSGPPWSVKRPISCMVHDHEEAGEALAQLRRLTKDYTPPPDACGTYRSVLNTLRDLERDMHIHIHKENNILFPAGIRAEERLGRVIRRDPAAESATLTPH